MRTIQLIVLLCLLFGRLLSQTSSVNDALNLMAEGRYAQAAHVLEQELERNPDQLSALKLLGQARLNLQQYAQAAQAFSAALNMAPSDSASAFWLAKSYAKIGKYEKAESILKSLLKNHTHFSAARIQLAKLYYENENFRAAGQIYDTLCKQFPLNPYFFKQAGRCALKNNHLKKAEANFRKALQLNPADLQVAVSMFNVLKKEERWPEALNVLNLALASHPKTAKLYLACGDVYLSMKKYRKAREDYSRALSLGDSSSYLYKKIGVAYYYLNDYAAALYALQKSAQANPEDPLVFYFLGLAQKNLSMPAKAIESFKKALTLIFPSYLADIYFHLADSYADAKDYQKALQNYKKVLQVDPGRKIVLFYMATIYDRYYRDLKVPLRYYRQFLEQADEQIPQRYKTYAMERMKSIKEKLHFQKGKKGTTNVR